MKSLEEHEPVALDSMARIVEKLETPVSAVDPADFDNFINSEKNQVKTIDVDLKDARRRITAAKGPRKAKRKSATEDDVDDGSGTEGSASA